ncbi:putative plant lipid transfer protein/Par allergen [Helianthus annuus]|uniref:Plant lipid transfer protein/Par allergen n=2 Tax=Helianthus annuus TaxID=4232 RepID=A0A251SAY7_HELAN|nr:putative plant lipid transfer protein/Par allergen [Helianthus annuus]KAJ0452688.1 putative plant non-specific lipid-transfer protein/Par allergen [Helianthus annuus]KAJ0457656.1 putative plant lipid transfer protein/Par allergen [Helianthus annuus]KAJ0474595.1 putative plant non-specific lipid-transfer protein/Par allergen [Helianthus annuus]KAJ0650152.1 putative plant non-specific lipid-transfer protein/Par allergen [Helianthus annuus]
MWLLLWLLQKAIEDKLAGCNCLKSALRSLNPNPALAKTLPGNCGISLGFTMSANIDCTKFVLLFIKGSMRNQLTRIITLKNYASPGVFKLGMSLRINMRKVN